jgi:spore coat polysaccharide biosynthesis protein SpsF
MNNNKTVLIVQARMGSKRLPGKSLLDLAGEPLVGRILERVKRCKQIDDIVLAVPEKNSDDILAKLANIYEVNLFRGSEDDLLDRYYKAALKYKAKYVCRLPGDNPIPEPDEIDRMILKHKETGYEFSSNLSQVFNNNYPDGIGIEVINFEALKIVWAECKDRNKREHVHLNFFNYDEQRAVDKRFRVGTVQCPHGFNNPNLILDVNTKQQYDFIKRIYDALYYKNPEFSIKDVVKWYQQVFIKKT